MDRKIEVNCAQRRSGDMEARETSQEAFILRRAREEEGTSLGTVRSGKRGNAQERDWNVY